MPSIVISDVEMPDLSGFELCRRIKENDLTNHIPVMLLTGSKTSVQNRTEGITLVLLLRGSYRRVHCGSLGD
ncbi:MAG: response regulator [Chlorobiales bacterium]